MINASIRRIFMQMHATVIALVRMRALELIHTDLDRRRVAAAIIFVDQQRPDFV